MSNPVPDQHGFGVSPGRFNGVKLELGIILCLAMVMWLVVEHLTVSLQAQVLMLGVYGLTGMVWLMVRARRILHRARQDREDGHGKDGLQLPMVD
jgi:Flp pilus assembly protein TadB